jgi:hypothetical protein
MTGGIYYFQHYRGMQGDQVKKLMMQNMEVLSIGGLVVDGGKGCRDDHLCRWNEKLGKEDFGI